MKQQTHTGCSSLDSTLETLEKLIYSCGHYYMEKEMSEN